MLIKKMIAPSLRFCWLVLAILLAEPKTCSAELILSIDWDPVTPGVQNTLSSTSEVNSNVRAAIVAELTGGTTLYYYRVSVRYDPERLAFVQRSETTRVSGFLASFTEPILDSDPGPLEPQSGDGFTIYRELQRFDGEEETGTGFLDATTASIGNGITLGVIDFTLLSTSGTGPLIKPGLYESTTGPLGGLDVPLDTLTGNDGQIGAPLAGNAAPNPDTTLIIQVGTITAVPEPSSLLLLSLSACGLLTCERVRRRGDLGKFRRTVAE